VTHSGETDGGQMAAARSGKLNVKTGLNHQGTLSYLVVFWVSAGS